MDDGCGGSMVVEDMSVRERRKRRKRRKEGFSIANLNVCVRVEGGWCSYVSFEISLSTTSPILLDEKKKCHQPLPPSMSATTISSHGSLATSIQLSDICNLYTPI